MLLLIHDILRAASLDTSNYWKFSLLDLIYKSFNGWIRIQYLLPRRALETCVVTIPYLFSLLALTHCVVGLSISIRSSNDLDDRSQKKNSHHSSLHRREPLNCQNPSMLCSELRSRRFLLYSSCTLVPPTVLGNGCVRGTFAELR